MKKYFFVTLLTISSFFITTNLFAFSDKDTHPDITEAAVYQSLIGCEGDGCTYLKDYLGFNKKLNEVIGSDKIITLLRKGSQTEDSGTLPAPILPCSRGLNHFYDPTNGTGLDEVCNFRTLYIPLVTDHFQGIANPDWAKWEVDCNPDGSIYGVRDDEYTAMKYSNDPNNIEQASDTCNEFSWHFARLAFIVALTSKDNDQRNRFFGRTFRSVGQVAHLLQDMAVPAHVRNDMQGHLYWSAILYAKIGGFITNWVGNNFEAYVFDQATNLGLIHGGGAVPTLGEDESVETFWDSKTYRNNGQDINNIGSGLAEYTAANFLSQNKMLDAYTHPSINDGDVSILPRVIQAEDGKFDYRYYFSMAQGSPQVQHLAATSVLNSFSPIYTHSFDYLDDECHKEYASCLVPKAVDYSTGLINYFFRGTLAIERPDRYVYSIADGSKLRGFVVNGEVVQQQYFDYIKAKVRNSTDYNGGEDPPMGPGKLWAVAKYKMRTNYDPELAKEPPIAAEREENFSYSISAPKDGVNLSLDWQEFEFNFSGDPIPAGITDLYLQVVYQGTLGSEIGTAVAVGMKDLSEPTHFVAMNATDRVYVNYILRTTQEIIDNATARSFYFDNCSDPEDYHDCTPCMYPFDVKIRIAFGRVPGGQDADYDVVVNSQPAGSYSRIIFLTDEASFTATITRDATDSFPCMYPDLSQLPLTTYSNPMPSAVNQEDSSGVFHNTPLNPIYGDFRQIYNHGLTAFLVATPLDISLYGLETMDWPQLNGSTPIPITINR